VGEWIEFMQRLVEVAVVFARSTIAIRRSRHNPSIQVVCFAQIAAIGQKR